MDKPRRSFFPVKHFHAIIFRRWVKLKRSMKSVIVSLVGTLVFSCLAIILQWLMILMMKPKHVKIDFNCYSPTPKDFVYVGNQNNDFVKNVQSEIIRLFQNDIGKQISVTQFENTAIFNAQLYENVSNSNFFFNIPYLIDYQKDNAPYQLLLQYNSSRPYSDGDTQILYAVVNTNRALWKYQFGDNAIFELRVSKLLRRLSQRIFGQLGPMLIACGLISIVPLIISQPIGDIVGEVRPYMISCTLRVFPYWVATFVVDYIMWIIVTLFLWFLFNICWITSFHDNLFNTWYVLTFAGPSFIIFIYCASFLFSNPTSAARQAFMILIVILIVPVVIKIVRDDSNPQWLDWIYSLFPHIIIQQLLGVILTNMGEQKRGFGYYWRHKESMPYLIMEWGDIIIYSGILWIIEMSRLHVQRMKAKKSFGNYHDFFKQVKQKHPVTSEAHEMEKEVHNSRDYAVRICDVSRLFLNTAGDPIPAVNCVSLGVKEGSLFGFLGANGAGKTTLIRMITGLLPPSDGEIDILGTKIEDMSDMTTLSICPQFNTHLCHEMTPREHFKMYTLLFQMSQKKTKEMTENLMNILELQPLADKPLRELSGGDVRKLAIALSFLGPARIILLDEPTASLDPVARHSVHEMILEHKGKKTFMLCTHLLSEAENLCDTISIMIKGTVYTVGSPEYLTQKFGTEYKIDVMLDDDTEETAAKCDDFFFHEIPTAELSIQRPKARIYSVPASGITLPQLFRIMQNGCNGDFGFSYYTCSSSSLERVFMEIVKMSENDEVQFVDNGEQSTLEEKKKARESQIDTAPQLTPLQSLNSLKKSENDAL